MVFLDIIKPAPNFMFVKEEDVRDVDRETVLPYNCCVSKYIAEPNKTVETVLLVYVKVIVRSPVALRLL
jgi:hypothetical protein